ncbi:Uncharacterised protein [Mycobacteroides abscessus subsp. abscessus]|nr:Uncharacterised protein [Mycobacteroides abscessus subsp. abscessus]
MLMQAMGFVFHFAAEVKIIEFGADCWVACQAVFTMPA